MSILKPDDAAWFKQFPARQAHIRRPAIEPVLTKQRAVRFETECEAEFRTLGPHDKTRRRIILWKVPAGNPHFDAKASNILKIPFLAFADETIGDEDAVLLPIVAEIMGNAFREMGNVVE